MPSGFLRKLGIFNLYLIYCFDIAAIVIVYIIFTPLIVQNSSTLVSLSLSQSTRNIILGLLFAAYPTTQFFGAPILGDLSDHFGRRKILIISSLGTAFCFFLSAMSILSSHLVWLFISRLAGGFFAGNASLAQATVSDLTEKKRKSSAMALFTAVGGLSWIIGPFLGSFLSNPKIVSWFNYDVPFWFLGLLFLTCTAFLVLTLESTKPDALRSKLSIMQSIKNLASIFHLKILIIPFLTSALGIFAWMIIQSYTAPFLMEKFNYTFHSVSYVYAYYSFFWLCGGLFAIFWLKKHAPSRLNFYCLLLISLFIFCFTRSNSPYAVYHWMPVPDFLMAISMSAYMSLFSHIASQNMQGKVFGAYTGSIAIATAFAPAVAGWFSMYDLMLPFILAACILFLAAGLYFMWLNKQKSILKEKDLY